MTELWLIGCIHNDPKGEVLLRKALTEVSPELITVEISKYSIKFRQNVGPKLRAKMEDILIELSKEYGIFGAEILNHPHIFALWRNLFMPYEYSEALRYAEDRGAKVFPVDISKQAKINLAGLKEAINEANIRALYNIAPEHFFIELENVRLKIFEALKSKKSPETINDRRDAYMASRIKRLILTNRPKVACHIGGWEHVLPASTLFEKLYDLSPKVILL